MSTESEVHYKCSYQSTILAISPVLSLLISSLYSQLQALTALPHSTFPVYCMCLPDFPCLRGYVDVLHQAASSSCPRLEPLASLPHSTVPVHGMCLLYLPYLRGCVYV